MSNVDTTLRTVIEKLTEALPGDLAATPRLVVTDSESLAGIAFCVDHQLPRNEEHEYSACDNCEVIDCLYRQLAELVHALLLAREPIAAWMTSCANDLADARHHVDEPVSASYALTVACVINRETA